MGFYEIAKKNLKNEMHLLEETRREMKSLPKGSIVRRDKASGPEYYIRKDGLETYIPKAQRRMVNDLKRRRVLEKAENIAEENIKAMERMLKKYRPLDFEEIERNLPRSYRYLDPAEPNFQPGEKIFLEKAGQHFTQSENPYMRDKLVNSTYFGLKTRSKSEAIEAEALYRAGFSVYYEKRLILYDENGRQRTVYTDFTIPLIMDYVMYWEHNGLLDDEVYLQRNIDKLRLYHLNGIYQPKNLIITADKPGGGLDSEYIDCLVNNYLVGLVKMLSEIQYEW